MKQWHQQKLRESLTGSVDLPQNATFQQEIHRWSMFRRDLKDKPSYLFVAFHFGWLGLLPKHSRNLPHSTTNHANGIRTMWTVFFCFEVSKAMEQNSNRRGQTKRTSIIAHSQRRKCWQGQNTTQILYG